MRRFRSILLPVAEGEDLVEPFRADGNWSSAHGVPPHITIAGPWPLSVRLPSRALEGLAAAIQGTRFVLAGAGELGDAICLSPEDDGALLRWRASVLRAVGTTDAVDGDRRHLANLLRGARFAPRPDAR